MPSLHDHGKQQLEPAEQAGRHIDHVLLNPHGTHHDHAADRAARAQEHEGKTIDLADHYGVVAEILLAK